jgi:hypothetical protein
MVEFLIKRQVKIVISPQVGLVIKPEIEFFEIFYDPATPSGIHVPFFP